MKIYQYLANDLSALADQLAKVQEHYPNAHISLDLTKKQKLKIAILQDEEKGYWNQPPHDYKATIGFYAGEISRAMDVINALYLVNAPNAQRRSDERWVMTYRDRDQKNPTKLDGYAIYYVHTRAQGLEPLELDEWWGEDPGPWVDNWDGAAYPDFVAIGKKVDHLIKAMPKASTEQLDAFLQWYDKNIRVDFAVWAKHLHKPQNQKALTAIQWHPDEQANLDSSGL